ncbi:hypothetical protein IWQ61_006219 [Dispira simplex]|nr:hypothetical protein IWQ61_006219 [Dispira simplex]
MLSWSQIQYGFQLGLEGGQLAVREPKVRRWFGKALVTLVVTMVVLHFLARVLIHVPLFLLRGVNATVALFAAYDSERVHQWLLDAGASVNWALQTLPLTGVLLVRSLYSKPFDAMFMTMVQTQSAEYYQALVNWPHRASFWTALKHHFQRTWRRVKLVAVMLVLVSLPVVGPYVPWLANFKLMSDVLGPGLAGSVAVLAMAVPGVKDLAWPLFKAILACQQLNRELLDPFFARLRLTPKDRRAWFRERQSLLLGFVSGFYLLIQIPMIGPAFFVFAQAAMGYWVIHTTSLDALARNVSRLVYV